MNLFISGTVAGQFVSWPLDQPRLGIGRASRNELHVPDPTVSKEHAEIIVERDQSFVRDLGSHNGTRVNGVDARQPLPLRAGDLLEIGHVQLQVSADRAAPPLRLSDATVVGSSKRIGLAELVERRTRTAVEARELVQLLSEAAGLLVLPRPLEETCEQILAFVARAVPASRYVLLLRSGPGAEPIQIAARMSDGATRQPMMLSRAIIGAVVNDCSSVLTADAAADARFKANQSIVASAVHSAMAVPLFDNEQVLGLVYVDRLDHLAPFTQEQVELLTLLANMAAVKIKNARLLENEQAALQMAQQLETAARIQRGLLPVAPPDVPGYRWETYLESCYAVGGDLFDFHRLPDGRILFTVGDVSGKGMGAALLMSSFMTAARVFYDSTTDLSDMATRLSLAVQRNAEPGRFVTGVLGRLDPATGTLDYVNAGHPGPCVVLDGQLRELEATGLPFGVLPEMPYTQGSIAIEPGALVAVFSDGLPEAQRGEEFYDDERIRRTLLDSERLADLADVRRAIVGGVDEFLGGAKRTDDLTLLLLRRTA